MTNPNSVALNSTVSAFDTNVSIVPPFPLHFLMRLLTIASTGTFDRPFMCKELRNATMTDFFTETVTTLLEL